MKIFTVVGILVVIVCFALTDGYAGDLSWDSNGYKWNNAWKNEKQTLIKQNIALNTPKKLRDYDFWIRNIDKFYDTNDPKRLKKTIEEVWDIVYAAHLQNEKDRHKFGD